PIFAAIGGAIAPAVIFGFINLPDPDAAAGWGIPMATDIAFAIAILAVVGRHLPTALRSFLLTLAIIDDLCVVVVIAVHYSAGVSGLALAGAIAGLGCFGWLQHGKGRYARWIRYLVPQWLLNGPLALIIWALTHASGVHATIAAVAMGLLMRTTVRPGESASPSHRADRALRPVSSGIVLPIFALTSAGIGLRGGSEVFGSPIVWGILLGLVVGKPLGIFATAWLTSRVTRTPLGGGVRWIDIACIGVLAGVGFTVALLVAELSYADSQWLLDAKAAILFGSAAAAVPAAILLGSRSRHYRRHGPRPSATPTDTPGIADGDDGSSAVR
ncbi:MAG: Na+/H+ antiporter NhaA, partial [Stackebrandtia sp.]